MTKRQVAQHKPGTAMAIGGPLPRKPGARTHGGLAGLLAGVSISAAALALAAIPQQARAQAVNGTPTVQFGADAPVRTTTSDSFNVTANDALIDWAVTDNTVFLNSGTTLSFARDGGAYTVLNRVASSPLSGTLAISGRVQSDPQGKIWFYNPGGWVVGSGATIDVGSLVLTANPIQVTGSNPDGQKFLGVNGEIRFGQAAAGSSVTIASGASISARQNDSYVALVAPRVVQAGTVISNGSTAYVAAGAVDIKINNGLFDIVVTNGTDDTQGVVHTGSTSGIVNNSSSATPQGIYLVAVPKNDALTMLVSGNLGYNSASSASQIGGKIVLSAGYGVAGGNIDTTQRVAGGSVTIESANLLSDTAGKASDAIDLIADTASGFVAAAADLTLAADRRIGVLANGGAAARIGVGGALSLAVGRGATGGAIAVDIGNGGLFQVGGNFDAHADGIGAIQTDPDNRLALLAGAVGEAATGGSVKISLGNATYAVGGQTSLSANAQGGLGGASAGSARAGSVSFSSTALTTLSPNSALHLQASADATTPQFGAGPTTGASATGGTVDLAFGGSFQADSIAASALATANPGLDNAAQNATGGSVSLAFSGAGSIVNLGSADLSASANAGNAGIAGGAAIAFKVDGATVNAPRQSNICEGPCFQPSSRITIDNFRNGNGSAAGFIAVSVINGGNLDLAAGGFGSIDLSSSARGGTGGTGLGATIDFTVDGGTVNVPFVFIQSDGNGRSGGTQSDGRGGDISVTLRNGGRIAATSNFLLSSTGSGGNAAAAGDGTGGIVLVSIGNGTLTSPSVGVESVGFAGDQFAGGTRIGTGTGGSAEIRLTNSAAVLSANFVSVSAPGRAGRSEAAFAAFGPVAISGASGGNGRGGTASVTVDSGSLLANTSLTVDATGEGGDGFGGGAGGTGTGGTASFTVNGGNASVFELIVSADGHGGTGANYDSGSGTLAGNGGAGTGGGASLLQSSGTLNTGSILLTATGNAPRRIGSSGGGGTVFGDGPATGGTGGLGEGGETSLTITGGNLANISGAPVNSISLDSRGVGGNGGDAFSNSSSSQLTRGSGGTGRGGTSTFVFSGGSADFTSVNLDASGAGGISGQEFGEVSSDSSRGGDGGSGFGGDVAITLDSPISAFTNFGSTRFYSASAGGQGAGGGDGLVGGAGGNGQGGSATLTVNSPDVFASQINLDAFGGGGNGGSSSLGNDGGSGGDGTGGTAQLLADGGGVTFAPVNGSLDVSGQGGNGGTGGSGQIEGLDAAGDGGTAGAGFGGTVRVSASNGATLDFTQTSEFVVSAEGSGGFGGDGGNAGLNLGTAIGDGGNGGDGTGGSFELTAQGGTLLLGAFSVGADGTGGSGGGRLISRSSSTDASNGGSGGNGFGGNVSFTASGSAGSIQADSLDVHVDGFGGSGTDGQGFDPITFVGASGGAGVAGTGGTIQLDSFDGGTISIAADSTSTLNANGYSAFGGVGAQGGTNPVTGVGGAGGTGGNSGQGNGGKVTLNAEGGLIETGDLSVFVNGIGSIGSQGGAGGAGIVPPGSPVGTLPTPDGAPGASGIGGGGVGGAVTIIAQNDEGGSVGGLDLGAVSLDVTGLFDFGGFQIIDVSGLVEISDTVDESNGGVNFASLDVAGSGDPAFNPITLSIYSIDAPIRIANSLSAGTGGTIDLTAIQTGGLEIGGQLDLSTDSSIRIVSSQGGLIHASDIILDSAGTTLVSAQNCEGPLCPAVLADNQFIADTGGDFALDTFAQVEAGNYLQVHARGNVTGTAGSGYRAPDMFISGENDVTIRNAIGGTLRAQGGLVFSEGNFFVNGNLTLGEADGSGVLDLSGGLYGAAGTSIDVLGGTTIDTGNAIELVAGDDIRIGAGASLTNTTGGSEPGFIRLDAGGLGTEGSYPAGNVASLLIGNGATIDGTGGSVMLSGGAIDGRGAIFRGADFTADVVNPPAAGVTQRNDNGQLTAPCLEGDICLGAIAATGAVRIGQGDSAPIRFTGIGNISGTSVAITTRETLAYGAAASPFSIASPGAVSLSSQTGDIALTGNALVSGGTVALSAAGSITGNGRLSSAGDIGIDVGVNITLASLVAGRQLTTVAGIGGAPEPIYSVPGNLRIGTFQVAAPTTIRAGGSIVIDSATTGGNDLELFATSLVSLGTDSNVANLRLVGRDVAFATINASGNIVLSAGNAIAGTSATAGGALTANGTTLAASALQSGGAMNLTTTGATTLGTARAGADLTIRSGALSFTGLTSTGATTIDAASIAGGNIAAGTSLAVSASGALALGSATAATTLTLDGASLAATTLRSGGAMTLTSSGAATLGSATSGGDLTATTGDLSFTSLVSTGATSIRASSVAGGDIAAGTNLGVSSPGAIVLGSAAAGGSLTLGGATIRTTSLRSGGATVLTSTGGTTLGTASAGTTFSADSASLQFAGITAAGDMALTAGTVTGADATSTAGAIRLSTIGASTVGQLRAATDVSAQATILTFAGITAGRNVTLDVTTLGGTAIVAGQDLTVRSVNDLTFGTIAVGRNLSLNASQGAITVNTDIDAGGTVSLAGDAILIKAAGPLTVATVSADNGDISISTDGLLRVSNAASRGDVMLTSTANSLILGPIVAGRALATPQALNASGTSKGTPGPGAITLSAAQSITLQGTVDALTALAATAGTLIDQRTLAVGKTIAYRSADLMLGQTAALGQSNFTTSIALTNTGSAGALLGDVAGTTQGYRLDNAEFGRIHSGGDVSLAAGSSLTVGTLSASAASGSGGVADGNIGATSTLALSTSGDLSVGGALALGNAAGNTLRLSSSSLTLDAGAGSVRLIEGSGHGGTLAIATGELSALTSAARTAIVGMDGNAINRRLAQNDGVSDGRTLFEAGAISIAASGRVLIQNTALGQTFDARRGFVADSFSISTSGSTQSTTSTGSPLIVINGTVAGQTGLTALRLVQVTGGYDNLSTVNGCRLFTATCGTPQFDPLRDLIEDEIGRGSNLDSGDAIGEGMLILIDRFEPLGFEVVIDEPVTGSGNDDFLVPEAGTGDENCEADDKTKCDKPPAQ